MPAGHDDQVRPSGDRPLIEWADAWNTGNATIDFDHQTLVTIMNTIWVEANHPRMSRERIMPMLRQLKERTSAHFRREEAIFIGTDFPADQARAHMARHREIEKVIADVVDLLGRDPDMLRLDEMFTFMRRWLRNHILKHDRDYIPYIG